MDRIIVRKLCDFLECSSFDRKVFKIEHNLRYLILTSILHLTTEKENRMLHILGTRPLTLIIELKNKSPSDDFYAAKRDALYL